MKRAILLLIFLYQGTCLAQDATAERMQIYAKSSTSSSLFVHFDKNVYRTSETVYFTGYLFVAEKRDIELHSVISVQLIRNTDSTVVYKDRHFMQKGLGMGTFKLPDSLSSGDYHFVCFTNLLRNGIPTALFIQPITIENPFPPIMANLKILHQKNDSTSVMVSVTDGNSSFLKSPAKIDYKYGNYKGTGFTDQSGQLLFGLKGMPDQNTSIQLVIIHNKDSVTQEFSIAASDEPLSLTFYPEGGALVAELQNNVGWEIRNRPGLPLKQKAELLKDGQKILETSTDASGTGSFLLTPVNGSKYSLRMIGSSATPSSFALPTALPTGIAITVDRAVATDTLTLAISQIGHRKAMLRIHNFKTTYLLMPLTFSSMDGKLKISLQTIPKGLATITLSDSLDRPIAERMFFAHYDESDAISFQSDRAIYGKREKVMLDFKLDSAFQTAIFSISCVQDNRLDPKKMTDIRSYSYLGSEMALAKSKLSGRALSDQATLEKLLLIKGWRKYSWKTVNDALPKDTVLNYNQLKFTVQLSQPSGKPTEKTTLNARGGVNFETFNIPEGGQLDLEIQKLIALPGQRITFSPTDRKNYKMTIDDQVQKYSLPLSGLDLVGYPPRAAELQQVAPGLGQATISLNEVTITKNKKIVIYPHTRDACGNYVCVNGIFNCPTHVNEFNSTRPVIGKTYFYPGAFFIYRGCQPTISPNSIQGIHIEKEFYPIDQKISNEPALLSTIYWNYGLQLEKSTPNGQVSFFTGDLPGLYRIIIQGITEKDVIYKTASFQVN